MDQRLALGACTSQIAPLGPPAQPTNPPGPPPPLMLAATEPQVIQQRRDRVTNGGRSPVRTRRLRLIWLPVPQETTSPAATLTPLSMDPPPQHHAPATTPATPPTPHQHRHQQWQNALTHATTIARTAKDGPEKMPRAPRTQGDEPTDTLQGKGGGRTPPYPQLRGRVRRGTSPGPEPLD